MRNTRALSLLLYIVALFVIPVCHITEVASATADCSACSLSRSLACSEKAGTTNSVAVSERCEPDNPCHNPNHTHHKHPLHDQHCSLCASLQRFANNPSSSADNAVLDFSSLTACQPIDDIIHNDSVSQAIDIRGPPIL
ncbi:MAG: hypothetical protein AAB038_05160 [Planctomycetota bacterium]